MAKHPPLRITLPAADRDFVLTRHQGLVLITPGRTKMNRSDWTDEELCMRSLVVREDTYEVVSAGFPKFFNAHESGADDSQLSPEALRLRSALAHGRDVYFTEKIDGSLCVRSVVDDSVLLRTRGALGESEHVRAIRALVEERYPLLLDPKFAPEVSLLFEFISPEFRIVLDYPQADLILLGVISHADLRLWDVPDVIEFARAHYLPMVNILTLPTSFDELLDAVTDFENQEGVVARCDEGNTLVKLKSASYLALHRLRFTLSAKSVRALCEELDVHDLDDFAAYLREHNADWELLADVKPLVQTYLNAVAAAEQEYENLLAAVNQWRQDSPASTRKDFALELAVPMGGKRASAAFLLFEDRVEEARACTRTLVLDERFQSLQKADEQRLAALDN